MNINCTDVSDGLIGRLKAKGYTVHQGKASDAPELGQNAHWFCWGNTDGTGDLETGQTMASELAAWADAMEHWFDNSSIPKE